MATRSDNWSEPALAYLADVDAALSTMAPVDIAEHVRSVVQDHDDWRARHCISLNAAESVLSRRARALLASDMATRVSEGFPGDKEFPAQAQNVYVDELEATIIALVRRRFRAAFVEWRPTSTTMANATVLFALARPGDVVLAQPEEAGGNYSYNAVAVPALANLNVRPLPFRGPAFELDVEAAQRAILEMAPRLIVLGGSNVLFPYPLEGLRSAADQVGAVIVYDAAHVALLIAHGQFQDPLREGADLLTMSTHKIMGGPVGGLVLTNHAEYAQRILGTTFPRFLQTRDQNKYAATAHALAEMEAFGADYARQMVRNARALGHALEHEGFTVLARDREFTHTHQIFAYIPRDRAESFESRCQAANLLVTRAQRMGPSGAVAIRLTTQEITRHGMGERDMAAVAGFLRRLILDQESPDAVAHHIREFVAPFYDIRFGFDEPRSARL
jgi:glycine hydroxymethyltransferase